MNIWPRRKNLKCFLHFSKVREQHLCAFQFLNQKIISFINNFIFSKTNHIEIFFKGVFSDQMICQDCPHRYEREQSFLALNLIVKSNSLLESLDQFVRG